MGTASNSQTEGCFEFALPFRCFELAKISLPSCTDFAHRGFFGGYTGYRHEEAEEGEGLDQALAEIFGAEFAIVHSQFFSGAHAITCALFTMLRPSDKLLVITGAPHDTLEEVTGKKNCDGLGSLQEFGVNYQELLLAEDGGLNWDGLAIVVNPQTRCALIQRSCDYSWFHSLSVSAICRAMQMIKNPNCLVMVITAVMNSWIPLNLQWWSVRT